MFRIGEGYDVHKLVAGRKLILGGVSIDYEKGLLGHSDADVLLHAIIDSLFGSVGLNDIGFHFPDTDEKYKNVSSLHILSECKNIILKNYNSFKINNIDCTIICQKPKLRDYIEEMKKNIIKVLELDDNQINIKATTEEGLGFTGRSEGIAARAISLIEI